MHIIKEIAKTEKFRHKMVQLILGIFIASDI